VKGKRRLPLILGVVGAAALLGVVGWLGLRQLRLFRARSDVAVLTLALDGFAREHGSYPTGTCTEICALLRGEDVAGQNPKRLDYVEASAHEMNAAGEFIDPWGTPYRILTSPTGRAYSCGPNRIDEQGLGDDISAGD
jgi:type II secretory pathway pseudopilin PulG